VTRRRSTILAGTVSAALTLLYGLAVPTGGRAQIDHDAFLATVERMRHGSGYYEAFRTTYWVDVGVRLGGPRSYRTPYVFELWRFVPPGLLYLTFLVAVVVGTSVLLSLATDHPFAAVPVTVFLLVAGRTPGGSDGGVENWMLVELWVVPLLALSYLGWRRDRPWVASLAAAAATLVRELALPVLLVGLLVDRRHRRQWAVASATAVAGLTLHLVMAMRMGSGHGTEAKLLGSGHPPASVAGMLLFAFPPGLGVIVWVVGIGKVARDRLLAPVTVLLGLPLLGLVVDRPYWGILATPFVLLWAGELVGDVWEERSSQRTMEPCSDPRPAPSPTPPAPISSRTPTAG
jgi:hypothetical protein